METEGYKFPDELDQDKTENVDVSIEGDDESISVEIVDDTPKEDRNRKPIDDETKGKLEELDESEEYSKNVKEKFAQYKKAWHEERRAKEAALREQQEALNAAQAILDENKKLKNMLNSGEKELIAEYKDKAKLELEQAKRNYKEAYDSGDADRLLEAQQELTKAQIKLDRAKKSKPTVQKDKKDVKISETQFQQPVQAQPDPKVAAWVSRNQWFIDPTKRAMRRYAEGIHEDLVERYGTGIISTDEYFNHIDEEVARRFPEEFGSAARNGENEKSQRTSKPSTVVAPAKRSTASKKIVLTKSQVNIAKRLGLTPEQYAQAAMKTEV